MIFKVILNKDHWDQVIIINELMMLKPYISFTQYILKYSVQNLRRHFYAYIFSLILKKLFVYELDLN